MQGESGNRSVWQLTQEGLDSLLAAFHEEREEAARRYDRLRLRLTFFFIRRQFVDAESLADEVLDRMARRIGAGERVESPESYAYGVARFVAHEQERRNLRESAANREYVRNISPDADTLVDERILQNAMEDCLGRLSAADQELLLRYYTSRGREKIEQRRELALRLHLTQDALRKHTFLLRRKIEGCVRARLGGKAGPNENDPVF